MATESQGSRPALTRKQGIMIGVLGAILVGVLVSGQSEGTTTGATAEADPALSRPRTARQSASATTAGKLTVWPKVSLDEMLLHNPFAQPEMLRDSIPETPPAAEVEAAAAAAEAESLQAARSKELDDEQREKLEAVMAEFKNQKVKMILRTDRGVTAVIGDRKVREGDIIDGVRIVSIRPDGVIIEPEANATSHEVAK